MVGRRDASARLALDPQSLERLRARAGHSPDQALKAAEQQFESVFLDKMLKSMREAAPQDGMSDSGQPFGAAGLPGRRSARNMDGGGAGLADIVVCQLGGLPAGAQAPMNAMPPVYGEAAQQDFLSRMLPFAGQAGQASGVPVQLLLGQAALESGWGNREIHTAEGGNSFNLFGIRAGSGWSGRVAEVMTTEYKEGLAHKQIEKFRAYSSYAEAFLDYAGLISGDPRYAEVLRQRGSVAGMARAMQKAGYTSDLEYAGKLQDVMGRIRPADIAAVLARQFEL